MSKLKRFFYQQPALKIAQDFLGKYLIYNSPKGKVSGMIVDVEAYPAYVDEASHGNKRTKRTEIMFGEGGYVYVYLIYGMYYQFAIVVNEQNIPEVIFVRALIPDEGIEIMQENFGREVKDIKDLTKSPGNLCKALGIDMSLYGADLTGETICIEDRGVIIKPEKIVADKRVGIDTGIKGSGNKFRYYIKN